MFSRIGVLRSAVFVVLALLLAVGAAVAMPRGLIRSSDFSRIYWVDRFGVSHIVPDTGIIRIYFPNDIIKEISWSDFLKLPKGGPITDATPPEFYDSAKTRITMKSPPVDLPESGPPAATIRTIETALGSPPLVKKTTVKSPQGSTTTVQTLAGASSSLPPDDLLPATVEKRVVTTKTAPQVVEKKTEIITQPARVQRTTEVSTPDVVQERTELVTPAQVEQRLVTVPPRVVERRIERSFGAAPLIERHVETGVSETRVIETRTLRPLILERKVETVTPGYVEEESTYEY